MTSTFVAFCYPSLHISLSRTSSRKCRTRATADDTSNTAADNKRVNVNQYKSQRAQISGDKRDLSAKEVNDLMVKAGHQVRFHQSKPLQRDTHIHQYANRSTRSSNLFKHVFRKPRDLGKWNKALDGSYAVAYGRLLSNRKLVGFARATSDHALNGTIWDVVSDPDLPNEV